MREEKRKELLTREVAENLLKEWAEILELDTDRELYNILVDELKMSVRKERLTFDIEKEIFRYQLIKEVSGVGIVEIKECDFNQKKIIQRYKESESIESAGAMISKYTNLTIEQVGQLKDRDINKINAVIMGFLAQIAPGKK